MTKGTTNAQTFAASDLRERNFFLAYAALIWAATALGFGLEMQEKLAEGGLHYPLIVHAHALIFVAWLVLLTTQIALIRRGNYALHRRLGIVAVVLIPLMIFVAPATVIVTKVIKYGHPDTSFPFMSTQFTNVLAANVLFIAGLCLRRTPDAHKRLMLMGTLVISEPGFRRTVGYLLDHKFHDGFWPYFVETYGGSFTLMLGIGAYDLIRHQKIHQAYVVALLWCLANQIAATWLYYQPWWAHLTTQLVAH